MIQNFNYYKGYRAAAFKCITNNGLKIIQYSLRFILYFISLLIKILNAAVLYFAKMSFRQFYLLSYILYLLIYILYFIFPNLCFLIYIFYFISSNLYVLIYFLYFTLYLHLIFLYSSLHFNLIKQVLYFHIAET